MNCQDFEKQVLALARIRFPHSLEATEREQGLIHTEECERCAARLSEERSLLARVRSAAAEMAEEEPSTQVEKALIAAFRSQASTAVSSTVISIPSKGRRWSGWKLAAAAGILILISVMAIYWKSARPLKLHRELQAVSSPTPVIAPRAPSPGADEANRDQIADEAPKKRLNRSRRPSSINSDETEEVTQFFPLREGEDLTALESLQFVRVELPGSALRDVGLPVDPEKANEPVKADVVLGQDGLARAIRFVR